MKNSTTIALGILTSMGLFGGIYFIGGSEDPPKAVEAHADLKPTPAGPDANGQYWMYCHDSACTGVPTPVGQPTFIMNYHDALQQGFRDGCLQRGGIDSVCHETAKYYADRLDTDRVVYCSDSLGCVVDPASRADTTRTGTTMGGQPYVCPPGPNCVVYDPKKPIK